MVRQFGSGCETIGAIVAVQSLQLFDLFIGEFEVKDLDIRLYSVRIHTLRHNNQSSIGLSNDNEIKIQLIKSLRKG